MLPVVTNCSPRMALGSLAAGLTVDIARIRGKLLISPAQGSLAGRHADQVRAMPWQGRPQPAAPGPGVAQDGHEGLAAFIRLDGGLGLERARAPSRQRGPSPWPTGRTPVRRRCPGPFLYRFPGPAA